MTATGDWTQDDSLTEEQIRAHLAAERWEPVVTSNVPLRIITGAITTSTTGAICPDLFRLSDLGEADGWRGRAVRGFFWLLRKVTGL